ncbi:MAG: hypothetical protein F6J93_22250 [Oscillatoria sp. SIO1A7]|nr:hypothetical protein [Oscillatoria sp. SIO1A7]
MNIREIATLWYYKELWGWDLEKTGSKNPQKDLEIFLKTILIAANGDGKLTSEERDWVIGRAAVSGASDELLQELETYEANEDIVELVAPLGNSKFRRAIIYFAIQAAAADGDYNDEEKKVVRIASSAMGVSEEVVAEIETLYFEEQSLKEKRINLCFPDGNPFAQ